jgi:hypothetical protein
MKKLVLVLVIAATALALVAPAHAVCKQTGYVAYLAFDVAANLARVIISPVEGISPAAYHTSYYTANLAVITELSAAMAGSHPVTVTGDKPSCATSGATREGGIIQSLNVNPR